MFAFGGVGATPDDHTRQAAAAALGVPLARHPDALAEIEGRFGAEAWPHRVLMADFPEGAAIIPNPVNRIASFSLRDHHFFPGFPQMAWPMLDWVLATHYPELAAAPSTERAIVVHGAGESQLLPVMNENVARFPALRLFSLPSFTPDGEPPHRTRCPRRSCAGRRGARASRRRRRSGRLPLGAARRHDRRRPRPMSEVVRALVRALPLAFDRRVLLLVALPLLGAIVLWLVAAIAFGAPLTRALAAAHRPRARRARARGGPRRFATAGGAILAFVLITLVAGALALAAISVFAGIGVRARRGRAALSGTRIQARRHGRGRRPERTGRGGVVDPDGARRAAAAPFSAGRRAGVARSRRLAQSAPLPLRCAGRARERRRTRTASSAGRADACSGWVSCCLR